jgi:hypothetical protein
VPPYYAYLADSAAYLGTVACGIARELGRENDPEAVGKAETFVQSLRHLVDSLSSIPQEPYFGYSSSDGQVLKLTTFLSVARSEIDTELQSLELALRPDCRGRDSFLETFLRVRNVLSSFQGNVEQFARFFRGSRDAGEVS